MKQFKSTLPKRQIESKAKRLAPEPRPSEEISPDLRTMMAPPFVTFMTRQARFHAISLIRLGLFRWDELEDLSQDLRLDLLQRISKYRQSRGDLYSFARLVMLNRTKLILERKSRFDRKIVYVDISDLEQQEARACCPSNDLALACSLRIDVQRAVRHLPAPLRGLAADLMKLTVPEICANRGRSRSRIYQMIGEIRRSFTDGGLVG